ncbi:uncharacterized protein L201_001848 [Kwoniella dendrophila CBS 6074]|uniref:Uncharacterized protein n=1 Tax=Kwoniella dendrophila CBS 6074 TaxID=1295534 RepID=A0AAX4JQ59_9TREE
MPLSPVSVAVGATLATAIVVIGTGYAFKKFVYDPHLSHHIEALIAQHNQHHPTDTSNRPIPVSVESERSSPVEATSTSFKDHYTSLRRRNVHRESLDRHFNNNTGYELNERTKHEIGHTERNEGYGGKSKYKLDESRLSLLGHSSNTQSSDRLIELESDENIIRRSESPQEREVKEVIFRFTPSSTPLRSGSSTPNSTLNPSHLTFNPFTSPEDDVTAERIPLLSSSVNQHMTDLSVSKRSKDNSNLDPRTSSTSFSFLSLSQASSPEQIHPHLDSLHINNARSILGDDDVDEGTPTLPDDEEIQSISGTNHSTDYEDAESYTPVSRSLSRTSDNNTSHPLESVHLETNHLIDDLGLSYVPIVPITRGPLSVISVDGSELEMSEGEWDVVSDAGR